MKKLLPLLLFISVVQSASALNRYELLIGIHSGGAGLFYNYQGYNPARFSLKSQSVAAFAGGEILFGYKGFRLGYKFQYVHGFIKHLTTDYYDNTKGVDITTTVDYRRNLFNHIFLMEYAAFVRTKKVLFAVVPCLGVGGFRGYTTDKNTGQKINIYKDKWKNRLAIVAGLNFEITKRRFSFLIGPNYTLNMFAVKTNVTDKGYLHTITLNLDFRLNLLRPRY